VKPCHLTTVETHLVQGVNHLLGIQPDEWVVLSCSVVVLESPPLF
jgi:hypothetical protein